MKNYPKFLFAAGGKSVLVKDQAQHQALGPGFYESPADVPVEGASPAAAAAESAPAGAPMTPPSPEALAQEAGAVAAEAKRQAESEHAEADAIYGSTVAALVTRLPGISPDDLVRLKTIEEKNPKGARSSLLKAIDEALSVAK